jgi:WD40 repeat protein
MMKGKPWTPASLKAVGGTAGVGVTFLEETFSTATAPLEHRFHQQAARAVLQALLPAAGADIKGHMRSYSELLEASGYRHRPKDFEVLLRILDNEMRLLTPTDPDGVAGEGVAGGEWRVTGENIDDRAALPGTRHPPPTTRHYQLTHDYLVHSLRDWLTRKQKETRRGRAELMLEDRSGAWNARPENRQLPSLMQWLSIRTFTGKKSWTGPQRKMMRRAGVYHSLRGLALAVAGAAMVALVIGSLFAIQLGQEQEKTKAALAVAEEERNAAAAQRLLAEELSARQVMERGLALCEQGNIGRGLLLMSHSLKIAPAKADGLQQDIRANLAGWHRQIHPLKAVLAQRSWVGSIAFSPDGKTMVSGELDWTVRLWDVATAQPLPIVLKHDKEVNAVRFSPSGATIVSGSHDKSARLWDARTGELLARLPHPAEVRHVAFSPNGKLVATVCGDGKARLWDVATRQARELPTENALAVAFSPNGKWLAVGGPVPLWDVATCKPCALGPFQHTGIIETLAFSPDGKIIVTGSHDMTARLWDVAANKPLGMKLTHKATVNSVAFSPDGETIATGSDDGAAQLWDRRTGKRRGAALQHRDGVSEVAFSPDGKTVATASLDNTIRLWDVAAATPLGMLLPHPRAVKVAAFGPGGKVVLTASYDQIQTAQIWDAVTGMPIGPSLRQDRGAFSAAFSPDAKTVVIADAFGAQRWDVATGQRKGDRMIPHGPKGLTPVGWAVAYSPDGKTILHGTGDSAAYLWDAATGEPIGEPLQHQDSVEAVAFSPDGKTLLTGSMDKKAKLWDAATRQPLHQLDHEGAVVTVAFSPDGTTALTGAVDGAARLWEVVTGKPIGTAMRHTGTVNRAIFSPDGKTILTASGDGTARLWKAATQRPIGLPLAHQGTVRAVAFRPDGQTVVTGSDDGTAQVWDATTGKRLGTPMHHQGPVSVVDVSPDGKILTGSLDGNGRLSQLPSPVPGDVPRIVRWTEVITGMELDPDGVIRMLDATTWQQRRQELENAGGPPVPWAPDLAAAQREQVLRARQETFEVERERAERIERLRPLERQLDPRAKEEGFIQDWLILAPIPLPVGQRGARAVDLEQLQGEANPEPRAGGEVNVGGQKLVWQEHHIKGCMLDFNAFLKQKDNPL